MLMATRSERPNHRGIHVCYRILLRNGMGAETGDRDQKGSFNFPCCRRARSRGGEREEITMGTVASQSGG